MNRLFIVTVLVLGAVLLFCVRPVQAVPIAYAAYLDGLSESPVNASPGVGVTEVDIDTTAHTLHVFVEFQGLLGTTTASHIHSPTAVALAGTAGVATTTPTFAGFPLGVTSGTYDITLDMTLASSWNPSFVTANGGTTAGAEAAFAAAMAAGKTYLNIHTTVVPGGEIRGFLVVPEPASAGIVGFAGLVALMRRRRSIP